MEVKPRMEESREAESSPALFTAADFDWIVAKPLQ
jgi:hypothetical protein